MRTNAPVLHRPLVCLATLLAAIPAPAADWPRFRGPNGSGVPGEDGPLEVKLEGEEGIAWSTALPEGISSPCVAGSRIYLTGLRGKELITIALDRSSGKVLWERPAPAGRIEEVHSTSSPAASTPASDGERAIVFFGSFGLLAYDPDGKEVWRRPLGPFKNPFGAASSPIIEGDLAILNCDQDQGSFLVALEKRTGDVRWRAERPEFPRGFATPIIRESGGGREVVVAGTLTAKGYALEDGKEIWSATGLARIVNPTPVLGGGLLFIASYSPGGDAGDRISMPPFDEYAAANDADRDGRFAESEIPPGDMKPRFLQLDADKDGAITRAEWDSMARIFDAARNAILALGPGGEKEKHLELAWSYERGVPYVPSPLYYRGRIYMVKDGGILTVLDAATGKLVQQSRLPGEDGYYASPVAGDGRVYAASRAGVVSVIAAGADAKVIESRALGERTAATPAIADGRILIRTEKRLIAFGPRPAGEEAGGASR